MREIGSEFWLDYSNCESDITVDKVPSWLEKFGDVVFTNSGRSAISLMLKQIDSNIPKNVLLPSYICESVILPFIKEGYNCYFYEINKDLSPNLESISSYKNIGIFFHMGYFGFDTNINLNEIIKNFKNNLTIVVEDITHTLFTNRPNIEESDFYIGSLRKWLGLPTGGILCSSRNKLKHPSNENRNFFQIRKDALFLKNLYMQSGKKNIKNDYLKLFSEAEEVLDNDIEPYKIDSLSLKILNELDYISLIAQRRSNFKVLLNLFRENEKIEPIFKDIPNNVCPLFFPIYIKKNRDEIKKYLVKNKIYCPVHWPLSDYISNNKKDNSFWIYNHILSIPCDQRYNSEDMSRVMHAIEIY